MPEREYVPETDDEKLLALRGDVWGVDHPHTNPAFLKWLFRDTPAGEGAGIVGYKEDRIISFSGICKRKLQNGPNQVLDICHGVEFMVAPDMRGSLSGRLALRSLKAHIELTKKMDLDCSINFPNNNSVRMLTSNRMPYNMIFEPSIWVMPLKSYSVSKDEVADPKKRWLMNTTGKALSLYTSARGRRKSTKYQIQDVTHFDDRFDVFWKNLINDNRIRFVRDVHSLTWRYIGHPIYKYSIKCAVKNNRVCGYIVTSPRTVLGSDAELVCDLCVLENEPDSANALLAAAKDHANKTKRAIMVTQCLPSDPLERAYRKTGFIRVPNRLNPKSFRMIGYGISNQGKEVTNAKNWAFCWGDMDVV